MFIPDPTFFHPGSTAKNLSILSPKMVKLSEIWSGLFIPDPDPDFLPIPDPGSRGQKGTRSRIPDPDQQHWKKVCNTVSCDVFPECMADNAGSGRLLTPKISRVISLVHLSSVSATEHQRIVYFFNPIAFLFTGKIEWDDSRIYYKRDQLATWFLSGWENSRIQNAAGRGKGFRPYRTDCIIFLIYPFRVSRLHCTQVESWYNSDKVVRRRIFPPYRLLGF